MLSKAIKKAIQDALRDSKQITALTGAGISAESGIPTFRGPEGYWTIGSSEYHPQEMATFSMFRKNPEAVWQWYLYRMGICKKAAPNAGHMALVQLEKILQDRFTLITQNVDNLHIAAGNTLEATYQIHGNIFFVRCSKECTENIFALPDGLKPKTKGQTLSSHEKSLLKCPDCGALLRPHVLWFDETYNEVHYRFNSALATAMETDLLIIVGTSGATNLPNQVAQIVYGKGGAIIDINIEENPFTALAIKSDKGGFMKTSSSKALPYLTEYILKHASNH